MYKKQMTFQRIVCMALLAACALVFVYSLGLMTDLYDGVYQTYRNGVSRIEGGEIYMDMQEFNRTLTLLSIGLILVSAFNLAMGTASRRRYYIGNFVSIALCVICNVGVSGWSLIQIMNYRADYVKIPFENLNNFPSARYTESTFWFDASFVVFGILLVLTVLLVVNLVLKIMVMNSEKRLIGSRKDVRA